MFLHLGNKGMLQLSLSMQDSSYFITLCNAGLQVRDKPDGASLE